MTTKNINTSVVSTKNINTSVVPTKSKSYTDIFEHLNKIDNYSKHILHNDTDMQMVPYMNISNKLESIGRHIYNNNTELRDIATIMEHPEMYGFYLKYMRDPKQLKKTLVNMKVYDIINKYMYKIDPNEIHHNAYHKLAILLKLKTHPVYSKMLFNYVSTNYKKNILP